MIRRILAWLGRVVFVPRVPQGLGPMDVDHYEHSQLHRDRIATAIAIRQAEREREMTMLRVLQKSNTHKLLNS